MAGPHLERLRAQKSQKRVVEAHSKPSKPGFEGFEGDQCRRFLENRRLVEGDDATRKNSKNVTPAYPQNLQNLNSKLVFPIIVRVPPGLPDCDIWPEKMVVEPFPMLSA